MFENMIDLMFKTAPTARSRADRTGRGAGRVALRGITHPRVLVGRLGDHGSSAGTSAGWK
jgi:hypothetical protein